jgi:dTDP-4-dehydrorhamnose 3,5-epimerase
MPHEAGAAHIPGLPAGVRVAPLRANTDARGSLTEVFRNEWNLGPEPVQWNLVRSKRRVLRGLHVHLCRTDYLVIARGQVTVALHDLRPDSATRGAAVVLRVSGSKLSCIVVPPGVGHGFYCHTPALVLYGVSAYWDPADELGCFWSDPALGIAWPDPRPVISARDAALPSVAAFRRRLRSRRTRPAG